MKLPDFAKCIEFLRLRENMGVLIIPILPTVKFTRNVTKQIITEEPNTKALDLEKKLKNESITVDYRDISVDENGLLNIEGLKVAAYIRDQPRGIDYYKKYSKYRYHLCNCRTLQYMSNIGREKRYLTTKRTDGLFEVFDTSDYRSRKLELKLDLCKNCVDELNDRGLWFIPFSLKKYFEKYDSKIPKTIRRIETVTKVQNYTPNQDDLSHEYRKAVNYECQKCGVDCSSVPSHLHLHHRDGDKSNNERSNLCVLCIDCHSREPMHEHLLFPNESKRQVSRIQSLRKEQGILELGLNL
jgi:hypothetical protein